MLGALISGFSKLGNLTTRGLQLLEFLSRQGVKSPRLETQPCFIGPSLCKPPHLLPLRSEDPVKQGAAPRLRESEDVLEDGVGEEPRLAARELSFEEGGPLLLENLVPSDVILRRQREQKRPTQEPASAGSMLHGRNKMGCLGFKVWWDPWSPLSTFWKPTSEAKSRLE